MRKPSLFWRRILALFLTLSLILPGHSAYALRSLNAGEEEGRVDEDLRLVLFSVSPPARHTPAAGGSTPRPGSGQAGPTAGGSAGLTTGLEEGESPRSVRREEAYQRLPGLMKRFREFGGIPFTRPRSDDLQVPPLDSAGRSVALQKVGIAVDLSAAPEDALGVFYLPFGTTAFVGEESFIAMLELTGQPIPRGVHVRTVRDGNLQQALLDAIRGWSERGIEGLRLFSTRPPQEVRQAIGEIQFPILLMDRHKTVQDILLALGADPNAAGTFIELYESSLGLSEYL